MSPQRISLAMIVRNEAARLKECLESVKDAVDEIVIVDTGSCDETMRIARQYTGKVYSFAWDNDFAAARNFAIEQTRHEWILSLDADERLEARAGALRSLVSQTGYSAYRLPLYALKEAGDYREHDRFAVLRLFQRQYRFTGAIHEYVCIADPEEVGTTAEPVICHIEVSPAERRRRRGRNIALLKKAMAEDTADPYLQYYLGVEWLGLGRYHLASRSFQDAVRQFTPEQTVFRSPAVRHLIQCYKHAGRLDEAICLCLEESQQYPGYSDIFFDGGVLFELKGEYDTAIKWFQEAIKLGAPPVDFFHTDGTDSYLSNYHLGYCAEKIGLCKEAGNYYQEALNNNKNYYYPLYSLVLLRLTQQRPDDVLQYLREHGYLAIAEVAEKMAELFWSAGLPHIGLSCLANTDTMPQQEAGWTLLAQCQLYSGKWESALTSVNRMRQSGVSVTAGILTEEITALLVLERFAEARRQLGELWRRPESRDIFRALFCLYKKLCDDTLLPLANRKAAAVLLELEARCLRAQITGFQEQKRFAAVIGAIQDILASEADTLVLLVNALNEREQDIKHNLKYTFTALRSLCR